MYPQRMQWAHYLLKSKHSLSKIKPQGFLPAGQELQDEDPLKENEVEPQAVEVEPSQL